VQNTICVSTMLDYYRLLESTNFVGTMSRECLHNEGFKIVSYFN
jgi:hypothetical protein